MTTLCHKKLPKVFNFWQGGSILCRKDKIIVLFKNKLNNEIRIIILVARI
jgi:hypothetical protein